MFQHGPISCTHHHIKTSSHKKKKNNQVKPMNSIIVTSTIAGAAAGALYGKVSDGAANGPPRSVCVFGAVGAAVGGGLGWAVVNFWK
jgi:hypothetical protein